MAGRYEKALVSSRFRERVIALDLLAILARDIPPLLGGASTDADSTG